MEASTGERAEQLAWESRVSRWAGLAALAALVLPLVAVLLVYVGIGESPREPAQGLPLVDERRSVFVAVASVQALSLLLFGGALAFLVVCSRFRRPETLPGALPIVIVGTLGAAVAAVIPILRLIDIASEFVASGPRTPARARELAQEGSGTIIAQVDLAARVAFGLTMVLVGVSAMRAGLVSRFLGILGVVVGALAVLFGLSQSLLLFQSQPLLFFWTGALALVLLDRWPGGRGPAWRTGEATPWPSVAEHRAKLARERSGRAEPAGSTGTEEPESGPPPPRKRKRRR